MAHSACVSYILLTPVIEIDGKKLVVLEKCQNVQRANAFFSRVPIRLLVNKAVKEPPTPE